MPDTLISTDPKDRLIADLRNQVMQAYQAMNLILFIAENAQSGWGDLTGEAVPEHIRQFQRIVELVDQGQQQPTQS